jgi:ABC-2 type transport system ATP-binding protein
MGRERLATMNEVFMHYTASQRITEEDIQRYGSWEKAFEAFEAQRADEE